MKIKYYKGYVLKKKHKFVNNLRPTKEKIIYTQMPVNYEVKNKPRSKGKLGHEMKRTMV